MNGSKQLQQFSICYWKKSNRPGLLINYQVPMSSKDGIQILENKDSVQVVVMGHRRCVKCVNKMNTVLPFLSHTFSCKRKRLFRVNKVSKPFLDVYMLKATALILGIGHMI